jgi:hypothetical protein
VCSVFDQRDIVHGDRVLHFRQTMVDVAALDRFRVSEKGRSAMCTPCTVHLKCWSCPGLNEGYGAYNPNGYGKCLLYLLWVDIDWSACTGDPYRHLLDAYGDVASYMTLYGRMLEERLNGKEMIDGRCAVCRVCTAAQSPPRPCIYPDEQRSSLEALGINVAMLSRQVLDHRLEWYREGVRTPAYVSVVHGLLTDAPKPPEMIFDADVSARARDWLHRWVTAH